MNTTATKANADWKSPHEMHFGRLPPANNLAFMQSGFRRIHRTHKSEPKSEKCFYLNRGRNHPRDCVKVVTSFGQTSDTRDVTWEAKRTPIIPPPPSHAPDTEAATGTDTAYHQASTAPHSADHALYNQPPPNEPAPPLPTFDTSELSEPTSYAEAMQSPYSANWSHAMEREVSGLEEAGTFGDA
ncbi:unnamed protein product [Laminaria digitata]